MKKVISFTLFIILAFSMISSAFAANVCGNIGGNSTATTTFTINTGSRWLGSDKVKLTQTKGKYEYSTPFSRSKTETSYMKYHVYYKKSGASSWSHKKWTGKNLTLSLKKNTTYSVKVVPYSNIDMGFTAGKSIRRWIYPSTWSVTSTKGILSCN